MMVEYLIYLELDYILADLFDNPRYIITLVDTILSMGIPLQERRLPTASNIRDLPILGVGAGDYDLDHDLVVVGLRDGDVDDLHRGTGQIHNTLHNATVYAVQQWIFLNTKKNTFCSFLLCLLHGDMAHYKYPK